MNPNSRKSRMMRKTESKAQKTKTSKAMATLLERHAKQAQPNDNEEHEGCSTAEVATRHPRGWSEVPEGSEHENHPKKDCQHANESRAILHADSLFLKLSLCDHHDEHSCCPPCAENQKIYQAKPSDSLRRFDKTGKAQAVGFYGCVAAPAERKRRFTEQTSGWGCPQVAGAFELLNSPDSPRSTACTCTRLTAPGDP